MAKLRGNTFAPSDDEKDTTAVIPAATPAGEMIDFLKLYPSFTMRDYVWGLSAPMIKIMTSDATQVIPLSEKQQQEYKQYKRKQKANIALPQVTDDPDVFCAALGIPTFG